MSTVIVAVAVRGPYAAIAERSGDRLCGPPRLIGPRRPDGLGHWLDQTRRAVRASLLAWTTDAAWTAITARLALVGPSRGAGRSDYPMLLAGYLLGDQPDPHGHSIASGAILVPPWPHDVRACPDCALEVGGENGSAGYCLEAVAYGGRAADCYPGLLATLNGGPGRGRAADAHAAGLAAWDIAGTAHHRLTTA
jgi:hypothetical protein